jgi:hypothetical protein
LYSHPTRDQDTVIHNLLLVNSITLEVDGLSTSLPS